MISPNDVVIVFVIFQGGGHIPVMGLTRKQASDLIRNWFQAREGAAGYYAPDDVSLGNYKDMTVLVEGARYWLKHATHAANIEYKDIPGESFALSAFAWSEVVGMYVQEQDNASQRLANAQEKIAKAIERDQRERQRGDEWRGEDEE